MPQVPREYPAGSIHSADGWEGQLARVSRWLDRLMNAESPADAEDLLYAFFQNAHHLRDWAPGGKTTDDIDTFLNAHLATRVCRDVANVTKHYELTRRPAQQHEPSILREYVGKNRGWFEDDSRLVVVTNHNNHGIVLDAREVAKECLRIWCEFLSPCDICDSIVSHFHFSVTAFQRVMAEAEGWASWAIQVMREHENDEQTMHRSWRLCRFHVESLHRQPGGVGS
jgi:hypothetical protein